MCSNDQLSGASIFQEGKGAGGVMTIEHQMRNSISNSFADSDNTNTFTPDSVSQFGDDVSIGDSDSHQRK